MVLPEGRTTRRTYGVLSGWRLMWWLLIGTSSASGPDAFIARDASLQNWRVGAHGDPISGIRQYIWGMPSIGPLELGIILLIVLIVFGPKRLPGLGRQLGSGMREFKDSITGKDKDDDDGKARKRDTTEARRKEKKGTG